MPKAIVFISILLSYCFTGVSQLKRTEAIKVSEAPRIDGWLDEEVWQKAPIATGFITSTPSFGNPASDETEVKIIYDNTSIYIGAYLHGDSALIRRQFTPRDQERQADVDHFAVFIDSYHDRQNAYQFLVTSRNVQSDARVSSNIVQTAGVYGDLSWDAVWDSKISMRYDGWVVEIKIPLFSIRFSNKKVDEWGIQFLRFNKRLNETSFWNPVNPNTSGFVNQFGDLVGVGHLLPPLRLSLSPYVSTGYKGTPTIEDGYKNEFLKSGGMDIKYGVSESFTLDATVIPDFGQVVSDNTINNISPFEIQFRENRQFFTEGTELFNKADIFYSRRIGKEPERYKYIEDSTGRSGTLNNFSILKNPTLTRLYNAIKFSGRTNNNLGIGIFNAIAHSEKAVIRNRITGADSVINTEGLTNYNVFVLDQALKNRSSITLTNTNVIRNGRERDANVTGLDIALYDKKNRYGLILQPRYSKIFNSEGGYDGFKNYFEFGKVSGKLQYSVSNELKTARYDPNDLGFLLSPNEVVNRGEVSYNIYQPTASFLNQQYKFTALQSYLYKPFEYEKTELSATSVWVFKNFWTLQLQLGTTPFWFNDFFELQTPSNPVITPRQKLKRSPYYFFFVDGSSDNRKRLSATWSLGVSEGPLPNDPFYKVSLETRFRFSEKFSLIASYNRQYDNGLFGFSFLRDQVTNEPLLARRKYADVTTIVSGIYNFTPRMNISFRARHFWNRILNTNLYNVKEDGYWTERSDLNPDNYNVNYNVFNLDLFYTWDFRLGSRIIFAWKNSLGSDYENYVNGSLYKNYLDNASRIMQTPHGNELTVRFIYFLDYQQLKRNR